MRMISKHDMTINSVRHEDEAHYQGRVYLLKGALQSSFFLSTYNYIDSICDIGRLCKPNGSWRVWYIQNTIVLENARLQTTNPIRIGWM